MLGCVKEYKMKKKNKMDLLPIPKLLFSMALPLMLSMLVQALYNIMDSMFVSYIPDGKVAFNAVSIATSMQMLLIAVGTGVGVGMNSLLSKSLGEKDEIKVNRSVRNAIIISFFFWFLFILIGLFIPRIFMESQTGSAETVEAGVRYLRIVLCGSLFVFLQFVMERMLQGTGRAHLSMVSQISGALTNIALDPIFIFTLGLGIEGAAYATVIGQGVGALVGFLLNRFKNPDASFKRNGDVLFDKDTCFQILRVGIPSMIMVSITSVLSFGIMAIISGFSDAQGDQVVRDVQNAYGAYIKLQSFVFMPLFGMNNALVPIIAFHYGAGNRKKIEEALRLATISGILIMAIGLTLFEVLPGPLLKIFNAEDSMIHYGTAILRIIAVGFIFAAPGICISAYFQALGNGISSMCISLMRQLIGLLPVAYLLSLTGDVLAVWWAFPIAEVSGLIVSFFLYRHRSKQLILSLS